MLITMVSRWWIGRRSGSVKTSVTGAGMGVSSRDVHSGGMTLGGLCVRCFD
jgi:hypothetical protein